MYYVRQVCASAAFEQKLARLAARKQRLDSFKSKTDSEIKEGNRKCPVESLH